MHIPKGKKMVVELKNGLGYFFVSSKNVVMSL
jgi:hypothetical protein